MSVKHTYTVTLKASDNEVKQVHVHCTDREILAEALDQAHRHQVRAGGKEYRVVSYEVAE